MKVKESTPVPEYCVEYPSAAREKVRTAAPSAHANDYVSPRSLPTAQLSQRATESLTAADRVLLEKYLSRLEQACSNIITPVSKITIDAPPDPEEGVRSIVVTCHFDVDADTALSYWELIGREFDLWATGPEEDTAQEVLELISTNLRWRV